MAIGTRAFTLFRNLAGYTPDLWKLGPQGPNYHRLSNTFLLLSSNGITESVQGVGPGFAEAYLYAGTDSYFLYSEGGGVHAYMALSMQGSQFPATESEYQSIKGLASTVRL